jgi:hypothetical protein
MASYIEIREQIAEAMDELKLLRTLDLDGRVESGRLEDAVIAHLSAKLQMLKVEKCAIRSAADLTINSIPINVKITTGMSCDNAMSKEGLCWSLGCDPKKFPKAVGSMPCELFRSKWREKRNLMEEYHYLVIYKKNDTSLHQSSWMLVPMLDVESWVSNPSNYLQISWKKEFAATEHASRDWVPSENIDVKQAGAKIFWFIQDSIRKRDSDFEAFKQLDIPKPPPSQLLSHKKSLGQFFTTAYILQSQVASFIRCEIEERGGGASFRKILEPGAGRGHLCKIALDFLDPFEEDSEIVAVEKDTTITRRVTSKHIRWMLGNDYLETEFPEHSFDAVISNPPYVASNGKGNLYLEFMEKSIKELKQNGFAVFIVPSDIFTRSTKANSLFKKLSHVSHVKAIFFPRDEKLFVSAAVDVCVICMVKCVKPLPWKVLVSEKDEKNKEIREMSIFPSLFLSPTTETSDDDKGRGFRFGEMFDFLVGIVGPRKIFEENDFNSKSCNQTLICGIDENGMLQKTRIIRYHGSSSWDEIPKETAAYLKLHEETLRKRKTFKITDDNWFQWMERNTSKVPKIIGRECIYISTMTRNKIIAVDGGRVEMEQPWTNVICAVSKFDKLEAGMITAAVTFLNSEKFRSSRTASGRFLLGAPSCLKMIKIPFLPPLL